MMYNPYQFNPYNQLNAYQMSPTQMPGTYQNQNVLPQQQIIQVNGKASVDTIQLAPNSSILVMDTSAPIVWMCVSDGVGKTNAIPYDITPHKDQPPVDVNSIEQRLAKVEESIEQMKEKYNDKSNAYGTKSKQSNVQARTNAEHD